MEKLKVGTVIVTHNRKHFLRECVSAVLEQTYKTDIIIVDNASTDGTKEIVDDLEKKYPNIYKIRSEKNVGGTGGFNIGIKEAYKRKYDWIWVMDDDVQPDSEALEELIKAKKILEKDSIEPGFLSSLVLDREKKIHPMNKPKLRISDTVYKYFDRSIIEIQMATFVGCLINRKAIKRVGLPIKEFFIWFDDYEYTLRISEKFRSYLVGSSQVIHETKSVFNLKEFKKKELWKYKYEIRNRTYYAKKVKGISNKLAVALTIARDIKIISFSKNFIYLPSLSYAVIKGLFFNPKIEMVDE